MRTRALLPYGTATAMLLLSSTHDFGQGNKPVPSSGAPVVTMCTRDQLSLGTDDENGNFDGMSHSGTLLVVRNLGENACRMPAVPVITLLGKSGKLHVTFSMTGSTHPGPVIVAAGAELTSSLRWVSNDVYDPGFCVDATSIHIQVGGQDLGTAMSHQLCGQKGKAIEAEMTAFKPDPVYRPGKPSGPSS